MDDKRDERFVDELLDASLQRYRSEDPRAGLESRILAKVLPSERVVRQRGAWVWAFGAATGAVILLAVVTFFSHRKPAPQLATYPAPRLVGPGPASAPQMRAGRTVVRVSVTPTRQATPKQTRPAQFPTPAPLSDEERLLLAYVSQPPKQELSIPIIRDPKIDLLEIPELKIARLEIKKLPKLDE